MPNIKDYWFNAVSIPWNPAKVSKLENLLPVQLIHRTGKGL